MEAIVLNLLVWISANTTYVDAQSLQLNKDFNVKIVSQQNLNELYFIEGLHPQNVGAVYEPYRNTVYLSQMFNSKDLYEVSLLLHEIIHVLQDRDGSLNDKSLYKKADAEAYDIQAKWLRQNDLKMEALLTTIVSQYLTTEMIE